jgi:hypothetical protein
VSSTVPRALLMTTRDGRPLCGAWLSGEPEPGLAVCTLAPGHEGDHVIEVAVVEQLRREGFRLVDRQSGP